MIIYSTSRHQRDGANLKWTQERRPCVAALAVAIEKYPMAWEEIHVATGWSRMNRIPPNQD